MNTPLRIVAIKKLISNRKLKLTTYEYKNLEIHTHTNMHSHAKAESKTCPKEFQCLFYVLK